MGGRGPYTPIVVLLAYDTGHFGASILAFKVLALAFWIDTHCVRSEGVDFVGSGTCPNPKAQTRRLRAY